jgi:hypothetical protein
MHVVPAGMETLHPQEPDGIPEPLEIGEWAPIGPHMRSAWEFFVPGSASVPMAPCPAQIGVVAGLLPPDPSIPRVPASMGYATCTSCRYVTPVHRQLDGLIRAGFPPLAHDS